MNEDAFGNKQSVIGRLFGADNQLAESAKALSVHL